MPELGTKHTCTECETKFYDLGNPDATCPQCGAPAPKESGKSTKAKKAAPPRSAPKPKSQPKPDDDDSSPELEEE